jgi:alkylated DNA repair dioxygenase AlkB
VQPLLFQHSLFDAAPASLDPSFSTSRRIALDAESWLDHAPGWVRGSDRLFEQVLGERAWGQRTRWMYDGTVREPRLTSTWELRSGEPLRPALLEAMRTLLSERYGVELDSAGFNLYRDGRDSVAWHGDRIDEAIEDPVVALVSLGEARKFLVRPRGGGRSLGFRLGRGDLLVAGGRTQRAWEHCVPKVARAGPRITIAFRNVPDGPAYAPGRATPAAR